MKPASSNENLIEKQSSASFDDGCTEVNDVLIRRVLADYGIAPGKSKKKRELQVFKIWEWAQTSKCSDTHKLTTLNSVAENRLSSSLRRIHNVYASLLRFDVLDVEEVQTALLQETCLEVSKKILSLYFDQHGVTYV